MRLCYAFLDGIYIYVYNDIATVFQSCSILTNEVKVANVTMAELSCGIGNLN